MTCKEIDAMWDNAVKNAPVTTPARYEFARLVAAAEREACAKICDENSDELPTTSSEYYEAKDIAAKIRARGQP